MAGFGCIPLENSACGRAEVLIQSQRASGEMLMMRERTVMQEALFYGFRIEDHVPTDL